MNFDAVLNMSMVTERPSAGRTMKDTERSGSVSVGKDKKEATTKVRHFQVTIKDGGAKVRQQSAQKK